MTQGFTKIGDVIGVPSSTDNAIAKFSGTNGKYIQNSGVIDDDSDNITGVSSITPAGDRAGNIGSTSNAWDNVYADGLSFNDGTDILNTYEKQTFTPALGYSGSTTTPPTYVTQTGIYYKIGTEIYVNLVIVISNKGVGTGNVRLNAASSLPDSLSGGTDAVLTCIAANTAFRSSGTQFFGWLFDGDERIRFYSVGDTINVFQQVGQLTNTTEIRLSGRYTAAS